MSVLFCATRRGRAARMQARFRWNRAFLLVKRGCTTGDKRLLFKTYGNVLMAVKTTAHRTESSVCGPSRARYRFCKKRVTALSRLYLHSKRDDGSAVYLSTYSNRAVK